MAFVDASEYIEKKVKEAAEALEVRVKVAVLELIAKVLQAEADELKEGK